jgi:hypothetical protein
MKKIIRLTESDLSKIIKRVIKENTENERKINLLKSGAKGQLKFSPCWTKGMCPKVEGGDISQTECEFCPGPIAGILLPAVGTIATAILYFKNRKEDKQKEQEKMWMNENPELKDRVFVYFKDGSVQAIKDKNDVFIKSKDGSWSRPN